MSHHPRRKSQDITVLLHTDRPEFFAPLLAERFPQARIECCGSYDALPQALAQGMPVVALCHKFEPRPYPGRVLAEAPSLRWIHVGGTGVDHLRPWDSARLTVTNSAGVAAPVMAELALAGIYAINLGLPRLFRDQVARRWAAGTIRGTAGGTLVVVGLGRIGRAVAARGRSAGLRVIGIRSRPQPACEADEVHGPEALSSAFAEADAIVIALPLTGATRGLIGQAAFTAVRPGAIFVNLSRGGIVDESALLAALGDGRIRGALLDVFAEEPLPPDNPFWALDNVIVTPHIAGFVAGWEPAVAALFADNLAHWLDGHPLTNVVDSERGY